METMSFRYVKRGSVFGEERREKPLKVGPRIQSASGTAQPKGGERGIAQKKVQRGGVWGRREMTCRLGRESLSARRKKKAHSKRCLGFTKSSRGNSGKLNQKEKANKFTLR